MLGRDVVGDRLGLAVVGACEGEEVGERDGRDVVGVVEGALEEGERDGCALVGDRLGFLVVGEEVIGLIDGCEDIGDDDGLLDVGAPLGLAEGYFVGFIVGANVAHMGTYVFTTMLVRSHEDIETTLEACTKGPASSMHLQIEPPEDTG